jgi:hypothetical protein
LVETKPRARGGIVWLASYPKSGNTWLRIFFYHLLRLIGGHPREQNELNRLERACGYETRKVELFERFIGRPLAQASMLDVMRARPRVHAAIAAATPRMVLLKTHNLLGHVHGMPTVNPEASMAAIYITRDPRDIASSLANHLGSSVEHAIEVIRRPGYATPPSEEAAGEIWGSWSENVRSWTGERGSRLLVLRYEDMLAKPILSFTKVTRYLALRATPDQIREAVDLSSFSRLQALEVETGFSERPEKAGRFFASGKAGTWREKLSPSQVDAIVSDHGAEMARFGYLP